MPLSLAPAPHTHDLKTKTKQRGINLSSFDCFRCLSLLYLEAHGDKIVPSGQKQLQAYYTEAFLL